MRLMNRTEVTFFNHLYRIAVSDLKLKDRVASEVFSFFFVCFVWFFYVLVLVFFGKLRGT